MTEPKPDTETEDAIDKRLGVLVDLTNKGTVAEVGVMVVVGGTLFNGNLISREEWHTRVTANAKSQSELTQKFASALTSPPEEDAPITGAEVLHLAEVSVLQAGEWSALRGGVFRFRLDSVDGWVLGKV